MKTFPATVCMFISKCFVDTLWNITRRYHYLDDQSESILLRLCLHYFDYYLDFMCHRLEGFFKIIFNNFF